VARQNLTKTIQDQNETQNITYTKPQEKKNTPEIPIPPPVVGFTHSGDEAPLETTQTVNKENGTKQN
jgi:hypothetical protein